MLVRQWNSIGKSVWIKVIHVAWIHYTSIFASFQCFAPDISPFQMILLLFGFSFFIQMQVNRKMRAKLTWIPISFDRITPFCTQKKWTQFGICKKTQTLKLYHSNKNEWYTWKVSQKVLSKFHLTKQCFFVRHRFACKIHHSFIEKRSIHVLSTLLCEFIRMCATVAMPPIPQI